MHKAFWRNQVGQKARLEQDLTQHYTLVHGNKILRKPEPPSIVLHGAFFLTNKPQEDVERPQPSTELKEKKNVFFGVGPGAGGGRGSEVSIIFFCAHLYYCPFSVLLVVVPAFSREESTTKASHTITPPHHMLPPHQHHQDRTIARLCIFHIATRW